MYENLLAGGFQGELFAVNPNHKTVLGRPAYASLAAIGRPVAAERGNAPGPSQGPSPIPARFTQVDYDRELALVALDGKPRTEKIVAVARYVANPDGGSAEFAVVVADVWQGRGLGHALMRMLVGCARRRGFRRLVGNVLSANAPMLALVARLGFESRPDPDDREQVIVTLELEKQ